jgi:hypothetical protein
LRRSNGGGRLRYRFRLGRRGGRGHRG